jgi:PAS domain S-box-containing protein
MTRSIHRLLPRYGNAVLSVALTWMALQAPGLGDSPGNSAVVSCLAVLVGVWLGGLGPGLLVTALITLMIPLGVFPTGHLPRPELFAAAGVLICALVETLHGARRQAEVDARARWACEERHRRLLEAADEGILIIDAEARATYINPRMAEMLGCCPEDLLGRASSEILGPEVKLRDGREAGWGVRRCHPQRLRRRDGSDLWVTIATIPLPDHRGRPDGTLALVKDETEFERARMALRASERFARSVLDSLSAHVAALDESGTILAVNRAWRDFATANGSVGAEATEGSNYLAVCDATTGEGSEQAATFAAGIRDVLAGRSESFALEYPCHTPGRKRWFLGRVTPFEGDGPPRVVVSHEEVTEQKRAEADLARQQEVLQTVFDHIPVMICFVDPDGRVRLVNREWERVLGWSREETRDRDIAADLYPDPERRGEVLDSILKPLQGWREFRTRVRDGRTIDTAWANVLLSEGTSIGFGLDITERKRTDAALRESEERYRLLFETNPNPIWVYDAETLAFLDVNNAAVARYGYSRDEFLELTIAEIRPAEDVPRLRQWLGSRGVADHVHSTEWRHRKKDGTVIDVEIDCHPLISRGRPARVVLAYDVTERRRSEEALALLAEASAVLASSLDYKVTLAGVAHLAVPTFADLCVIRVVDDDGTLQPLAIAQTDPAKVELTRELYRRYRPDAADPHSAEHVLRTGQPDFLAEIPDAMVWGQDHDADHLRMLQDLGFRSYICAPLAAHGRTLGSISFLMAAARRRYTPADLTLVEDLAHRVALAVDNAKLYHEARRALRSKDEATALLDTLFATAPVGFAFLDRDLRFVRVNEPLATMNGASPAAHVGRTCAEVLPDLGASLEPTLREILRTGRPFLNREVSGETPAHPGVRRVWFTSYFPLRAPTGEILGVGGIVMEITERKRIEEAMIRQARHTALRADVSASFNREEAPLASTLRACVEAIVRHLDAALARVWTLDASQDMLELQASAGIYTHTDGPHGRVPVGTKKIGQIAQQRRPQLTNDVRNDPRIDAAWAEREGLVACAGHPLLVEDRLVGILTMFARHPLAEDDQEALAFVAGAMAQGIRRKLLEEERVALLARAQEARVEAEAASHAKDRFLAVLSHELRTPLTPVLMAVSALLEDDVAPEIRPTLEMICRNIELEARLIDDLLDVSLLVRGDLRLELETVDAHQAIHRAVEICQPEVAAADLKIALGLAATESHVRADRARLLQILWNLIRNAAKFTPAGGALTIRTRNTDEPAPGASGGWLVVEFHDTGIGIEPGVLARIFAPFEQGPPDQRRRFGGLGLGLSISRSLTEAHGGRLTAESPGCDQGATFRLELPMVPAPAPQPRALPASAVAGKRSRSLKILLLEDNKDTLRYLALVLRKHGHEVRTAENLAAARAAAVAQEFDLLLSDIELPDGTGLELMRELGGGRGVPGIAMSGFGSEEDIRLSRAAGFATHLTKPIDAGQLEDAIRRFAPAPGRAFVTPAPS